MKYSEMNSLEQAAVALRDCGLIYVTGNGANRFDPLVRLGLAETADMRMGGVAYRLTQHGHAAINVSGVGA